MAGDGFGYALQADEGEALWFLGNLMTVKAGGNDTHGSFTLLEVVAPPGPPHRRICIAVRTRLYLLAGEMSITCGNQTWCLGPGGLPSCRGRAAWISRQRGGSGDDAARRCPPSSNGSPRQWVSPPRTARSRPS